MKTMRPARLIHLAVIVTTSPAFLDTRPGIDNREYEFTAVRN